MLTLLVQGPHHEKHVRRRQESPPICQLWNATKSTPSRLRHTGFIERGEPRGVIHDSTFSLVQKFNSIKLTYDESPYCMIHMNETQSVPTLFSGPSTPIWQPQAFKARTTVDWQHCFPWRWGRCFPEPHPSPWDISSQLLGMDVLPLWFPSWAFCYGQHNNSEASRYKKNWTTHLLSPTFPTPDLLHIKSWRWWEDNCGQSLRALAFKNGVLAHYAVQPWPSCKFSEFQYLICKLKVTVPILHGWSED